MGKSTPIDLVIYTPQTPEGKLELSRRIAEIHADVTIRRIKELNCSASQKVQLVNALVQAIVGTNDRDFGR